MTSLRSRYQRYKKVLKQEVIKKREAVNIFQSECVAAERRDAEGRFRCRDDAPICAVKPYIKRETIDRNGINAYLKVGDNVLAVTRDKIEIIRTRATSHGVISSAACQFVVAVVAIDDIIAAIAKEVVFAIAARDIVIATTATNSIVVAVAIDNIISVIAVDDVSARATK